MVRLVRNARFPIAPVPMPDGGLLYGERLTGRIRSVSATGVLASKPLSAVVVRAALDDQRGLLGLARTPEGRLFASWTRAEDGRLVVGEIMAGGGGVRLVWFGPVSADRANGGAIAVGADGQLLVGIGDLLADGALSEDTSAPSRRVLGLDPDGAADQRPAVVSSGWNNPYALVVASDGVPWVADNAGGQERERIGRADRPARDAVPVSRGRTTIAPAGLVALPSRRLGVCGFVSGRVDEIRIVRGVPRPTGHVLGRPCATGVALLADRRLVTLTVNGVFVSRAPFGV